ncbi:MAG: hypothetical protein COA38_10365 [Fluviicola sp.]|nr:MAG: hypothetical protein COA38_10365 [Fluviicola sp.]
MRTSVRPEEELISILSQNLQEYIKMEVFMKFNKNRDKYGAHVWKFNSESLTAKKISINSNCIVLAQLL